MYFIIFFVFFSSTTGFDIGYVSPPEVILNFTDFVAAAGHRSETHETTTEDGYILTLFNIPGNKSCPVLIMHGALDTADSFVIGNQSLGIALADQGYDVWIGNYRGNRYNRRHVRLNSDNDPEFWNFTFHEIGYYDLPANIDYILNKTGQTQLSAIGFSLGTTIFYVLGSTRQEYNEKIKIFISLAPIAQFKHAEPPVSTLISMASIISRMVGDRVELFARNSREYAYVRMCSKPSSYVVCKRILAALCGSDADEISVQLLHTLDGRFPDSIPKKLALNLAQMKNSFSQYDYGSEGNLRVYNSTEPPAYNMSSFTMKTAMFVGKRDRMSIERDVEALRDKLPNVVAYHVMKDETFSHLDFNWGKKRTTELFPYIFELLKNYSC